MASAFAAVLSVGCTAESGDETSDISTTAQEINGVLNASGCTAARQAKLQAALTYAFNRVKDSQYSLAECMNRSYIYNTSGRTGVTGWSIAGMLAANNITSITCANLGAGTNAQASLRITGEALTASNSFIDGNETVFIAGVIAHEILHNRGFGHGDAGTDTYYTNCASEQVEACFNNWVGNTSIDKGYVLFWDAKRAGNEPTWTRANAVSNCSWNKTTYPAKRVECFYNNARLGYELFIGGSNIESRVGFEPAWTVAQATANCESNVKSRPGTQVECLFDGRRIGYELYFDGTRVGKEPTFTLDSASANCSANKTNYPNKKVECFYNGDAIGYELLWDGKRVGFEPAWSQSQASTNCSWNKSTYPSRVVECLFNGKKI
jgi:hypothetical protein